jgi:hypothetical protein
MMEHSRCLFALLQDKWGQRKVVFIGAENV